MAIYYKYLFGKRDTVSDSEGMVYSYLVFKALENSDFFDRDTGKVNIARAKSFIISSFMDGPVECLELDADKINKSRMVKDTGLSRGAVYRIIERLKDKGIIKDGYIHCPPEMLDEYFEYPGDTKLTGQQLVFYGFLLNRGRNYHDIVDTRHYRLAELFCTSEENIDFLISILKKRGYIEKLNHHRIKIKRNHHGSS